MNISPNKTPIEVIKVILVLETFILLLMRTGTKIHGKNLLSYKILMQNFMHQIIMMWM